MKSSHTLANWLFERAGLDAALTGDLLEERQRGRSAIWYWSQVLVAMCVAIVDAVRSHKVDTVRVLAMGFALQYLAIFLWTLYGVHVPMFSFESWTLQSFGALLPGLSIGWLIADRERPLPTVMLFAICLVIWFLAQDLFWVRLLLLSVHRPMFRPDLVMFFMTMFSEVAGIIIGALSIRPRKPVLQ